MDKNMKVFKHDVEVPVIVRAGLEDTLARIKKENVETMKIMKTEQFNGNEGADKERRYLHFFRSQTAAAACVIALTVTGITAAAAGYHFWSRGISSGMQVTESQKAAADADGLAAHPAHDNTGETVVAGKEITSAEHDGVAVSVEQTVVDNYRAVIALRIHGLKLEKDAAPWVDGVSCDIEGADSNWGAHFYDGTIRMPDGTWMYEDGTRTGDYQPRYVDENGDLEYDFNFTNTGEAGALIGRKVVVSLTDLGIEKEDCTQDVLVSGSWDLSWTLRGSDRNRTMELNEKIGDTGAVVTGVELSPISVRITMDWPYQAETERGITQDGENIVSETFRVSPYLKALLMKDGAVNVEAIDGPAFEGYTDKDKDVFVLQMNFQRIIDPDEVTELLFATEELNNKIAEALNNGRTFDYSSCTADDFDRVPLS